MQQDKTFLGTEPVGQLLRRLAIPTVIAQLVNMLYNIVDRIYIGHIPEVGSLALTGVGVCLPIILIVSAFACFTASGGAPRASIYMGRDDMDSAEKTLGGCFTLQIGISIVLTAVLLLWGREALLAFGASENTIGYAADYLHIYAFGTLFVELGERIAEKVAVLTGHAAEEHVPVRRAQVGHGEVLLDGHVRRGALERVLEQVANAAAALIRRQERDVPPIERDGAGIDIEHAGNGIEERALAGTVGADDGGKLPVGQLEREVGNSALLVHGAGIERLGDVGNFKHRSCPPFRTGRAACGHWT